MAVHRTQPPSRIEVGSHLRLEFSGLDDPSVSIETFAVLLRDIGGLYSRCFDISPSRASEREPEHLTPTQTAADLTEWEATRREPSDAEPLEALEAFREEAEREAIRKRAIEGARATRRAAEKARKAALEAARTPSTREELQAKLEITEAALTRALEGVLKDEPHDTHDLRELRVQSISFGSPLEILLAVPAHAWVSGAGFVFSGGLRMIFRTPGDYEEGRLRYWSNRLAADQAKQEYVEWQRAQYANSPIILKNLVLPDDAAELMREMPPPPPDPDAESQ